MDPFRSPRSSSLRAFSYLEAVAVLAVLGIIAAVAIPFMKSSVESTRHSKLENHLASANASIKVYLANGGSLDGITDPQAVLDKLKSVNAAEANHAGLGGSLLDKRLTIVYQSAAEAATSQWRAHWSPSDLRFTMAKSGAIGIKEFTFNEELAQTDYGTETRTQSNIALNSNNGWIWNYNDTSATTPPSPTAIPLPGSSSGSSGGGSSGSPGGGSGSGGGSGGDDSDDGGGDDDGGSGGDDSADGGGGGGGDDSDDGGSDDSSADPDDSDDGYDSDPVFVDLNSPGISTSASAFHFEPTPEVTVTITNPNSSTVSTFSYRVNDGTWEAYSDPFVLNARSHLSGADIEAKAVATGSFVRDSTTADATVTAPTQLQLATPLIAFSAPAFTDSINNITVTLTDPNSGGSSLYYAITNQDGGTYGSPSAYGGPFTASSSTYPNGFKIQAQAVSADAVAYLDSGTVEDRTTTDFFGVTLSRKVMFIIDVSGSMDDSIGGGLSRLDAVTTELISAVSSLTADDEVALGSFNGSASLHHSLAPATSSQNSSITNTINYFDGNGWTNYTAALGLVPQSGSGKPDQVVFLTDGMPTSGGSSWRNNTIGELAAAGIPVDVIGFDVSVDGISSTELDTLSSISDGTDGSLSLISGKSGGGYAVELYNPQASSGSSSSSSSSSDDDDDDDDDEEEEI